MNHADILKLLYPLELTGVFAGDIAIEGAHLDAAASSAQNLLKEMYPETANLCMPDWERVCGITPATDTTLAARRAAVLQKLRAKGGQSRQFYIDLAAYYGITITIDEFVPSMCGWTRAGDRLMSENQRYVWRVNVEGPGRVLYYARAGSARAGEPLLWWQSNTMLENLIRTLKPAHTHVIFTYSSSGTVPLSNMKISAIDDYAFADIGVAGALTNYIGGKLEIYDSSGNAIGGYIKAAGTGETYGGNLITNGAFDSSTTGWNAARSVILSSVTGGQSGNCLQLTENGIASPYASQNITLTHGALYKWDTGYVKAGTAATYAMYLTNAYSVGWRQQQLATSEWVNKANGLCFTSQYSSYGIMVLMLIAAAGSGQTILFDEQSIKQILTPSATGVTIVSEPNGEVQNWTGKNNNFNYADANGYTYKIIY